MEFNNSLRAIRLNSYKSGKRPTVKGIVLHDTAGSGTLGDAKYLANDPENRGVSVDFVILRDGEIYKLNPDLTRYSTNHAGRRTHWKEKGLGATEMNGAVIGIELVHNVKPERQSPEWPTEQVTAAAHLCKYLCEQFKLDAKTSITTHAKLITDGSRSDPRKFPFDQFWVTMASGVDGVVPATPATSKKLTHTVVNGDTLWGLANKYMTSIEKIKALNDMNSPSTLITVGQQLIVRGD